MEVTATVEQILSEYGTSLWATFVSFVITGFILLLLKELVADVVYYYKARMSDIGFGQQIYFQGVLYTVKEITFRHIVIYDEEKIIRVPIKTYLSGPVAFPNRRS